MEATEALKKLQDGNQRFVDGKRTYPHLDAKRLKELADGQAPFVTVLSCSDSRVPPEHLFDQGLGDVFSIRVAGNVSDTDEIGSMEYGIAYLKTPLLVVLGHSQCGAVTAVATKAEVGGSIPQLVENIQPAVRKAAEKHPELSEKEIVPHAIEMNVWKSIEDLFARSEYARDLARDGSLMVVGAVYHLEDGKVQWMGEHPEQDKLVGAKKMPATTQSHGEHHGHDHDHHGHDH